MMHWPAGQDEGVQCEIFVYTLQCMSQVLVTVCFNFSVILVFFIFQLLNEAWKKLSSQYITCCT